jgi:hypothetical protein
MKLRILSVSRRTDIPAFYTPWFLGRLRAGFCTYPNPLFPSKIHRVSLRSEEVLGIAFWTRHVAPLLPHLAALDRAGYHYYFHYSVTGYPRDLEPRSPPWEVAVRHVCALARHVGAARVIWRYDPLILNHAVTPAWHLERFRQLADRLAPVTRQVVVSVVDPYAQTRRRLGGPDAGVTYEPAAYVELLCRLAQEAAARNLRMYSCAETLPAATGITPGRCVDAGLLHELRGSTPPARLRRHGQRAGCLCHESVDIGANNACPFACQFCYATRDPQQAREAFRRHDPAWSALTGEAGASLFTT